MKFRNISLIVALLFAACHNNDSPTTRDPTATFAEPPMSKLPVGNFQKADTLKSAASASIEIYSIINVLLSEKKLFNNYKNVRYNCEVKTDTSIYRWLSYFISKKVISKIDTVGIKTNSNQLYSIDWSIFNTKNCITLKEAFRGYTYFNKARWAGSTDVTELQKLFKASFNCDVLQFISYPLFNKEHSMAAILATDFEFGDSAGSSIFLLKKVKKHWKLVFSQLVSAT